MSHWSKRDETAFRCPICGVVRYALRGERYPCPYKALHRRAAV